MCQLLVDGLNVLSAPAGKLGDLTWPIIRDLVDGVITVSEEEILHATQLCCENLKVWHWIMSM